MGVVGLLDEGSRTSGQIPGGDATRRDVSQSLREGARGGRGNEDAGAPVDDDLGDAADEGGDHGSAHGHGFKDDGGEPVDVAVGAGHAGCDENV